MSLPVSKAPLSETRIAVDDGYIWPIDRARMVSARPIRERMIEDIAAAVTDGGEAAVVTMDDLRRKGWAPAQVEAHASTAFAIYKAEHSPRRGRRITGGRDTVRRQDSLGRIAGSAAAAIAFVVATGLVAGLASGLL